MGRPQQRGRPEWRLRAVAVLVGKNVSVPQVGRQGVHRDVDGVRAAVPCAMTHVDLALRLADGRRGTRGDEHHCGDQCAGKQAPGFQRRTGSSESFRFVSLQEVFTEGNEGISNQAQLCFFVIFDSFCKTSRSPKNVAQRRGYNGIGNAAFIKRRERPSPAFPPEASRPCR